MPRLMNDGCGTRELALDEFVAGIEPPVTKAEMAAMRERLA